jgi:hypothetical protein
MISNQGSKTIIQNIQKDIQEFSLLHVVQTGSGVHPTSYPMSKGAFSLGVKRPRREADHSPPDSAEVRKMWIYTSTSPYAPHDVVLN